MICVHRVNAQLDLEVCIVELGLSDEQQQQEPRLGGVATAGAGFSLGLAVLYRVYEHPATLHLRVLGLSLARYPHHSGARVTQATLPAEHLV